MFKRGQVGRRRAPARATERREPRVEGLESRVFLHAGHAHSSLSVSKVDAHLVVQDVGAAQATIESTVASLRLSPTLSSSSLQSTASVTATAVDRLPDVFAWANESRGYVYGWTLDTTTQPGRTLLRLTTAVPNAGAGPMELRGGNVNTDGTQNVYQRIYDTAGGYRDRLAGRFTYHSNHGHLHFDNYAQYHLRAVTSGSGVGSVVRSGDKVSFCLLDVDPYNLSLPGARQPSTPSPYGCGQLQGISVGWADVYQKSLPDQWIDVTGVADGQYWLEVVVDPLNLLAESDESNNTTRVLITLNKSAVAVDTDDQISEA